MKSTDGTDGNNTLTKGASEKFKFVSADNVYELTLNDIMGSDTSKLLPLEEK